MPDSFDVVIVGARCAGSPLATLLARAGLSVCVVDRASFPSDTPSTHAIQPTGVAMLERLGVLDRLLVATPAINRAVVGFDEAHIDVDDVAAITGHPILTARRVTLDALLLEAAADAGAEVRTGTAVKDLVERDGRVAGVATNAGELRARLVVGADGARSTIARLVGAREYQRTRAPRVFLWSYFEGVDVEPRMWLGNLDDIGFLAFPTDAGLFMAAVVPSAEQRDELRRDRDGGYTRALPHWPELHEALAGARRTEPVQMMSRCDGFFRESAGPGWVLVGDAGHFKDPTPGQGIADALRQSVELAAAIERALSDGAGDTPLHDWWAWRDRDAWEMYWFALDLAAAPTPLAIRELQAIIAADPTLVEVFTRVMNHELAPSEAFGTRIALRATTRALVRRRGQRRRVLRETRELAVEEVRRALARRRLAQVQGSFERLSQ